MRKIAILALALLISLPSSLGLAQQTASKPARPNSESDRLRQELLVLLADVQSASAVLKAQSSYDDFMRDIGTINKRLTSIRAKHRVALGRGEHKALGAPISDACAALYAAAGDWKQVRLAANEVAGAQRAVAQAASWEADFYQRQLQAARAKQAEAQRLLTDHTKTARALVRVATRAQEESKKQTVAAGGSR